jgi:cytochrome c peroxidase
MNWKYRCWIALLSSLSVVGCTPPTPEWELANLVVPLPEPPLGVDKTWSDLSEPPTPEKVRLGRWLYYDTRLSSDNTIACATCHIPENAFSEPEPVSTGIRGQKGTRKAPTFINAAWALLPHTFWDGRAASLEDQALGPVANPIEMGNTHEAMVQTIIGIEGYAKYFEEAFGSPGITKERIADAIADYERTRLSGNSPYDRWKSGDESAVSEQVKLGERLFFDKAGCNQCHLGYNFTDSLFHNLGVGWEPETQQFRDQGRYAVTHQETDMGAFKTPTVREATKRAPYMHDGSVATLREVVQLYNRGGEANPHLDPKIKPLNLTEEEIDALVAMMEALAGEGYMDTPPTAFPQ